MRISAPLAFFSQLPDLLFRNNTNNDNNYNENNNNGSPDLQCTSTGPTAAVVNISLTCSAPALGRLPSWTVPWPAVHQLLAVCHRRELFPDLQCTSSGPSAAVVNCSLTCSAPALGRLPPSWTVPCRCEFSCGTRAGRWWTDGRGTANQCSGTAWYGVPDMIRGTVVNRN